MTLRGVEILRYLESADNSPVGHLGTLERVTHHHSYHLNLTLACLTWLFDIRSSRQSTHETSWRPFVLVVRLL